MQPGTVGDTYRSSTSGRLDSGIFATHLINHHGQVTD
jgi:hypothetical protein